MNPMPHTNRRNVLKLLAASTAAPLILPRRLFGQSAPSKKITIGCIGVGWQGGSNLDAFLGLADDCRVVAICDWIREIQQLDKKGGLKVPVYKSENHHKNFLDCIKSRQRTITPVEIAHRSQTPGHLGYIASVTGRKLKWDAAKQVIVGDPEASKMILKKFRDVPCCKI